MKDTRENRSRQLLLINKWVFSHFISLFDLSFKGIFSWDFPLELQGPNILEYKKIYPNCTPLVHHSNNVYGGLNKHRHIKQKRALKEIEAGLGIKREDEFTFNEEQQLEEKDLATGMSRLEGVLFLEESKGWETSNEDTKVLVKMVRQTQQIMVT